MAETCETCRFFVLSPDAQPHWGGDCRHSPPVAGIGWPTPPRDGWCGEYQPRTTEPEKPKARAAGYYRVRRKNAEWWLIAEWQMEWWIAGEPKAFVDDDFDEIDPTRIAPEPWP